jgi:hypothetical protein
MSVAITVAPSAASARASAAPCPPAAPVTRTILPRRGPSARSLDAQTTPAGIVIVMFARLSAAVLPTR